MKKHKKAMFFAVITCFLVIFNSLAESQVNLLSQRGNETVLSFQLSEYEIKSEVINGEECNYIVVPEICYVHEKGYPQLPRFSESILIPNNAAMGLEIVDIKYKEIKVKKMAPSKGVIYRDQNPADVPYVFGEIYTKDVWYPEAAASLSKPYIMRDTRGIVVRFQPFQYNVINGILKVAESMTVKIKAIGMGKINILTKKNNKISSTFDKIYQQRFINYSQLRSRYDPIPDGDKMIVISASDFMETMEPFVAWKNQIGIKTDIYEYPSETGDGSSGIENFIKEKYEDDGITYILLVGDAGDMPSLSASGGPSDPSYILLAGSDDYPDAFIGRFSGSNTGHIEIQVNKVLKYEMEPDPEGEWYHKGMGVASSDGSPKDKEWMSDMRDVMMEYNFTEVDEIYDPSASSSAVTSVLNDGRGFVNYMGHGSKTRWGTTSYGNSNVAGLDNGDMLPMVMMVACNCGEFDGSGDCLAEAFVKKADGGAIVAEASSITQEWKPPQHAQKEAVRVLCEDLYISIGAIFYNGECEMLDVGGGSSTFKTSILFGDPSLVVFTNTPEELDVTYPENVGAGSQTVEIGFGKAEIDGRVCLYHADEGIAGAAIVSGASSVEVEAEIPDVDSITLTVTARNKMPFEVKIPVGPTAIKQSDPEKELKLHSFPNPFSTTANISFNNPGKNALVTIYSSAGKVLVSEKVTENYFRWDAKDQTNGLYFVRVRMNDKVFEKCICLVK